MPSHDPDTRRRTGAPSAPPDVQRMVDETLRSLDTRQAAWADAVRQDSVEAVSRMGWIAKVRDGVRVPVHDLYVAPLRRVVARLAQDFIERAAPPVADFLGCRASELVLAGRGVVEELELTHDQVDLSAKRGWSEGELDFRLRFEREVQAHVAAVYATHIRAFLGRQLEAVARVWADGVETTSPPPPSP
jgi:hypothetical protein